MGTVWLSLKHNVNCCSILTDVVCLPAKKMVRQSGCGSAERKLRCEYAVEEENPLIQARFIHYNVWNRFQELGVGHSSRNIVEMIFRASFINPRKRCRKVCRVLKVNNSLEVVQKFEEYREYVRKTSSNSNEQHIRHHPRSTVDGNELRQFYGTTINCCGRKTLRMSQPCVDPTCSMCRVIQTGFNTPYNKVFGIRLGANSDVMSEDYQAIAKGKNAKRAVIICRTIAGMGFPAKNQSLVLCDPTAVLPCFVVVFD